jgi:hypothetical protein
MSEEYPGTLAERNVLNFGTPEELRDLCDQLLRERDKARAEIEALLKEKSEADLEREDRRFRGG